MADYDVQYDKDSGDWSAKRAGRKEPRDAMAPRLRRTTPRGVLRNEVGAVRFETTARTTTRFGIRTQSGKKIPTHRRASLAPGFSSGEGWPGGPAPSSEAVIRPSIKCCL